jgi:hypothetical protein
MGPNRIIGQSRSLGKSRPILRFTRSRAGSADDETHLNGKPLTVEHGAPLRLLVPVKLGLKNIKAITRITYTEDEPPDYWAKRGYSRYDGI